jgi:hypothetical protein
VFPLRSFIVLVIGCSGLVAQVANGDIVIDFEQAEVGTRHTEWVEQGVTFKLAHAPVKTKAAGRLIFFPHLGSGHKGILNAMAMEPIPVEARFPNPVSSVTLVLWGSTGCAAQLEALNAAGEIIERVGLDVIPKRTSPGDPEPFFDLSVAKPGIVAVRLSGPRGGEFLAIDEIRFSPEPK